MSRIIVFGAGGRAGRAVTEEALSRGHEVTAAVRDPDAHRTLERPGVSLVRGDVTAPEDVSLLAPGHEAAVHAVSPFSGPEAGFSTLDPEFFVKSADALLAGLEEAKVPSLLLIGLFANLATPDGIPVMDDPALFPEHIRPFALAHTAGLERLRAAGTGVRWLMLTPPAALDPDGPRTGRYAFGGEALVDAPLSYADLAVAVVDEIESPTHRGRVSVFTPAAEAGRTT